MGTACLGLFVFTLTFDLSSRSNRKRVKNSAWRASSLWLPLVGLVAAATVVHMPAYVVIVVSLLYAAGALHPMRSMRWG
jgi:hypothetical protein